MTDIFPHSSEALADIASTLLEHARRAGATDASATISESKGISTQLRQGRIKALSREVRSGVSLTAYIGQRQGSAHGSDLSPQSLQEMAEAACAIARHTTEDACSGLVDAEQLCRAPQGLGLCHPWEPESGVLIALAREIEDGITAHPGAQSDGVWASAGQGHFWLANTLGFGAGYAQSNHALSASVIAARDEIRTRDFWSSQERSQEALQAAREVGAEAARRSLALLEQRPIKSGSYPVLFDARSAVSLLEHLTQAISGRPLYMKTSFLGERFGSEIFPAHVSVIEDPFIPGGKASAPFDAEGVAGSRRALVDQGVLRGALLGSYSARKLGQRSTGNAGGCYNLRLGSALTSRDDDTPAMLRKLGSGLLVTGLSGDGVRLVSGDYSRAARGFWVENGEIAHAVDGVTIAGNLLDMWQGIIAVGADCFTGGAFSTGSVLIENMRVAGR
jgi:PmbA protein